MKMTNEIVSNATAVVEIIKYMGEKWLEQTKKYSDEEIDIINEAQAAFKDIFPGIELPFYLAYLKTDNMNDEHKYPAYNLKNMHIKFEEGRLGKGAIHEECRQMIVSLVAYYTRYKSKGVKGNFKAVSRIIVYIIEIIYALSKADSKCKDTLEDINKYNEFVDRLLYLDSKKFHEQSGSTTTELLSGIGEELGNTYNKVRAQISEWGANAYLDQLDNNIGILCGRGFEYAVRMASNKKTDYNTSLHVIAGELTKSGHCNDSVKRFCHIDKKSSSFDRLINELSRSLIHLKDTKTSSVQEHVSVYNDPKLIDTLIRKNGGVYQGLANETFITALLEFFLKLKELALLQSLIKKAKNVCINQGQVYYLTHDTESSEKITDSIAKFISTFDASYNNIHKQITDHEIEINRELGKNNYIRNLFNKGNEWVNGIKNIKSVNLNIKSQIESITNLTRELDKVCLEYERNPEKIIETAKHETNEFKIFLATFKTITRKQHRSENANTESSLTNDTEVDFPNNLPFNRGGSTNQIRISGSRTQSSNEISCNYPYKSLFNEVQLPEINWYYNKTRPDFKLVIKKTIDDIFNKEEMKKYRESELTVLRTLDGSMHYNEKIIKVIIDHYEILDDSINSLKKSLIKKRSFDNKQITLDYICFLRIELGYNLLLALNNLILVGKIDILTTNVDLTELGSKFTKRADKKSKIDYSLYKPIYKNILSKWGEELTKSAQTGKLSPSLLDTKVQLIPPNEGVLSLTKDHEDNKIRINTSSSYVSGSQECKVDYDDPIILRATKLLDGSKKINKEQEEKDNELKMNRDKFDKNAEDIKIVVDNINSGPVPPPNADKRGKEINRLLGSNLNSSMKLVFNDKQLYHDAATSVLSQHAVESVTDPDAEVSLIKQLNYAHYFGGPAHGFFNPGNDSLKSEGLMDQALDFLNNIGFSKQSKPLSKPIRSITDATLFKQAVIVQVTDVLKDAKIPISSLIK